MNHKTIQAIGTLRVGRSGVFHAAKYLRTEADYEDQKFALAKVSLDNPEVEKHLIGRCFPKDWEEIWKVLPPQIESPSKAISWATAVFCRYADSACKHVIVRAAIQSHILHGRWDEAKESLHTHETMFGPSLFALRWRFVLAEESAGSGERSKLLHYIRTGIKASVPNYFASMFSILADSSFSEDALKTSMRQHVVPEKGPLERFLEFLLLDESSMEVRVGEFLLDLEMLPLVDRYEIFTKLSTKLIASHHREAAKMQKAVKRMAEVINDPSLRYLSEVLHKDLPFSDISKNESLLACWDLYVEGDYQNAWSLSVDLGNNFPDLFHAHEMNTRSSLYLGLEPTAQDTPLEQLHYNLYRVFQKGDEHDEALGFLSRFASRIPVFGISASLKAFHDSQWSRVSSHETQRLASLRAGAHSPRNFEVGNQPSVNRDYLSRLRKAHPDGKAVMFFEQLASGEYDSVLNNGASIPELRKLFFAGTSASRQGNHSVAKPLLERFIESQSKEGEHPFRAFAIEEARRSLIESCRQTGCVTEMQRLAVKLISQRAQAARTLAMEAIWETCVGSLSEVSRYPEFAIIAYYASDDPHQVCLALKRYLRSYKLEKPSDLIDVQFDALEIKSLLLARVCTVDVLDSIPCLEVIEKVEKERLMLLDWVIENSPTLQHFAKNERMRLTQQAELRGALDQLDESRIMINVSSLRETEQQKFSDSYVRYVSHRDAERSRLKTNLFDALLSVQQQPGVFIVPVEKGITAFQTAYQSVRNVFLFSPHFGLEACLSGRIRHGILVQYLLSPYAENFVLLRNDKSDKQRTLNYWREKIACTDAELDQAMQIIEHLTTELDKIAREVRDVWIQSKTESQNPDGMFDYVLLDDQLKRLQLDIDKDEADEDRFVDRVLDALLKRTRENLSHVRRRVAGELRTRLAAGIDTATASLSRIGGGKFLPLNTALIVCKQRIEQACHELARWFHDNDTTLMGDADFNLIAKTAVGMVERLNPLVRNHFNIGVKSEFRVKGRHFNSLVYMLFFFLENAVKYSEVPPDAFSVELTIEAIGNQLTIRIQNATESPASAASKNERINMRLEELNKGIDPGRVIREGGTGLAKVIATMQYEFKQRDLKLTSSHSDCNVMVELRAKMEGIAA
ncbi:MAG: hypothetical protein ACYC67_03020 [Prosthecobacter sp.]